jgi:hypothetical protein
VIDGTSEKPKRRSSLQPFLGHLMKVISVIKRAGAVVAVSAAMYMNPSHAQYVFEPVVIIGSPCSSYGLCTSVPEIPGYLWVSYNYGSSSGFYAPRTSTTYGGSYTSIEKFAEAYAKAFKDPCIKPGEPAQEYANRAVNECTTAVADQLPAGSMGIASRRQTAFMACMAKRPQFYENAVFGTKTDGGPLPVCGTGV